jgi:hypothetical protein
MLFRRVSLLVCVWVLLAGPATADAAQSGYAGAVLGT